MRSIVAGATSAVVTGTNAALVLPIAYLGGLTAVSWAVSHRSRPTTTGLAPTTRFVVLVPAHNEETTIATMLASVREQHYPEGLFTVHVVADNCDDGTAAAAKAEGAEVHERFDAGERGKGPALNWLVRNLIDRGEPFDVAVFIDADTTVSPTFLAAMDTRFRAGAVAVQGHYGVREAFDSTPAALRYCALACRHHLRPLGRTAIGGSCGLFGNGMAFDRDLIASRRWTDHLVEDMEFQLELLLNGVLVQYEPTAMVEAEMPHTFAASVTQHQRWEQGRVQIARRYGPALIRRLAHPAPVSRVALIDSLLDICVLPLSLLSAATAASSAAGATLAIVAPSKLRRVNAWIGAASVATLCIHVLVALRAVKAPRAAYRALLQAPRLAFWKAAQVRGSIRTGGDRSWIRTRRNSESDKTPDVVR